jgi:hypothetical protein
LKEESKNVFQILSEAVYLMSWLARSSEEWQESRPVKLKLVTLVRC